MLSTLLPDLISPWLLPALLGAALITGIAKSGFGGGLGVVAVPLTALALPADATLAVMLPILLCGDITATVHHGKHLDKTRLWWTLPLALIGIVLGSICLFLAQSHLKPMLNLSVGGLCTLLVLVQVWRMMGWHLPHLPGGRIAHAIMGLFTGFVSTLTHAAGPIPTVYWLDQKLDKQRMVGTLVVLFLTLNLVKLIPYVALGVLDTPRLLEGLWLVPFVLIGAWFGKRLHNRIPEKPFAAVLYIGALLAGAEMIRKGILGI